MTAFVKPEHHWVAKPHLPTVLARSSEQELIHLIKSVKALGKDLRLIFAADGEAAFAVKAGHDLLKSWNDVLDRILSAKQARETLAQLDEWTNEGGASCCAPQLLSESWTDFEERPIVFAAVDTLMASGKP
jgi:hypothetical protein